MSPSGPDAGQALRALAFASPDGRSWGAAISGAEGWSLVMGPDDVPAVAPRVTEEPGGGWRLDTADGTLALLALPQPPPTPATPEQADETELPAAPFTPGAGPELCRVTGTAAGRTVDWPAVRARLDPPRSAKEAPGWARFVAGWFADGSAVGLLAARPRRHDRPDHDAASATLFDPDRWLAVSEPRLSTTYDGAEAPTRVSLELWIGAGEHEYPRRAAGEASGRPAVAAAAGARLQVTPLRCHSRGEDGVGVYVLATL